MKNLYSGSFGVEVMEAFALLKEDRKQEIEKIEETIIIKRKEMGKYKAESDLYEAMFSRFPKEFHYSDEHKKSNMLWSQATLDDECKHKIRVLELEIEEIDTLIARYEKESLKNKL